MPARFRAPLAFPVTVTTDPPRVLLTVLDAVAYLHERVSDKRPDTQRLIDDFLLAAGSGQPDELKRATAVLADLVNRND